MHARSNIAQKVSILKQWQRPGKIGCLLIGYEAFRSLVFYREAKKRTEKMGRASLEELASTLEEMLLRPGADIVICDEGHNIKNRKSAISRAVSEIRTRRRIILTGTPIQNNLKECKC